MAGKIADTNTRTVITLPKELKEKLEEIAKSQNRSFSNLVVTVLMEYTESTRK